MTHPTWFRIQIENQEYSSSQQVPPCIVGGSSPKRGLDQFTNQGSASPHTSYPSLTLPFSWLPQDFGAFFEKEGELRWVTLGQNIDDQVFHIRSGTRKRIENESIEL